MGENKPYVRTPAFLIEEFWIISSYYIEISTLPLKHNLYVTVQNKNALNLYPLLVRHGDMRL